MGFKHLKFVFILFNIGEVAEVEPVSELSRHFKSMSFSATAYCYWWMRLLQRFWFAHGVYNSVVSSAVARSGLGPHHLDNLNSFFHAPSSGWSVWELIAVCFVFLFLDT